MKPLNAKQQRFVAEYLIDLNATQAAKRAGYSAKRASELGWQLLQKPTVQAAVQAGQQKRLAKTGITADRVLDELSRIGFSDLRGIFDGENRLLPMKELPEDVARMIASVEVLREKVRRFGNEESGVVHEESVVKVRAWDKVQALGMLAKHLGLLKDKVEHSGPDGAPLTFTLNLDASRDRDV